MGYKPEIFQDELRKYREESRYSYDELAQRSGIPMKTLKRWILTAAPKSPPKRDRLVRLAAALNLTGVVLNHFFDLVAEPIPTVSEIHSEAERELDKDVKQILTMWAAQLDSGDKSSQADDPIAARVLQLPPVPPHFVGRDSELRNLLTKLHVTSRNKVIGVTGMGGVGKTSVAIKLAHLVKDRFEDGILWGQLGPDGSTPAAVAQSFATAFGQGHTVITALDEASKGAELRRILANKHVLVIFDNVTDSAQLRHLLPNGERNLTLITSRNQKLLRNLGAEMALLEPFAEEDSLTLLKTWIDPNRVQAELESAKQIAGLVDGLPLALEVVGSYLKESAELTLAEYVELLADEAGRLGEISDWEDTTKSVEASFSLSFQRLNPTTRQLFAALSIFPGPHFSSEAVAAIVDKNLTKIKQALGQLLSLSLIQPWNDPSNAAPEPFRYRLHALLKLYARSFLEETIATTFYHNAITYFTDFTDTHSQRERYPLLDLDWENIYGMLLWAADHQRPAEVVAGVDSLTQTDLGVIGFVDVRGYWTEARELLHKATEAALQQGEQGHRLASLFARLGVLTGRQGNPTEADNYFAQSRRYLTESPQSPDEILIKAELLAFKVMTEADNEAKYTTLEEALNLLENCLKETADERIKAFIGYLKIMQGGIVGETGNLEAAIELTQNGLIDLPDAPSPARFNGYINLSNFNYWLGQIEQCDIHTDDAIAMAKVWNDRPLLANLYALKGSNLLQQGCYRTALQVFQEALVYCRDIGYLPDQATTHSNRGLCYHRLGESDKALAELQHGFDLSQEHHLTVAEASLRLNLARYYLDGHNPDQAQNHAKQAHTICLDRELIYEVPEALSLQAEALLQHHQPEAALSLAQQALAAAEHINFLQAQGVSLRVLSEVRLALERFDEALDSARKSIELLTGQDLYEQGQSHLTLARCYLVRAEPQPALQSAHAALAIFEKLKAIRDQKVVQPIINALQETVT
ncbi:MAG: tetratricopeptide repeat protein [Anaerolineaceae bacterium]|nr:tetratricopeptide repeat protein [Anaerolineaceae bacterium]MCB9099641.1 tetratricopeptide repeat protein [Anaerolineales bacterium]